MLLPDLAERLRFLADKYENEQFLQGDPSRFLRFYSAPKEQELLSFVVSQLSFGQREQFIGKLDLMLQNVNGSPFSEWLLTDSYKKFFPRSQKKFYRFFSYADMNALCARLSQIVQEYGSLGEATRVKYETICAGMAKGGKAKSDGNASAFSFAKIPPELRLVTALISLFPGIKCVSQNPKGACKKLHMFLRWMVRKGSPVDLGLWKWASPSDLLIPLDTHVLQESQKLALIPQNAAANAKTAIDLTSKMADVFPGDPTKADFALFGLGVDKKEGQK